MSINEAPEPAQRLYLPGFAPVYAGLQDIAWLGLRVATGALLLPHAAQKLFFAIRGGGALSIDCKLGREFRAAFSDNTPTTGNAHEER